MRTDADEWDEPLPENIKAELISCIGEEATEVLLEARGGTSVFIPSRVDTADHWLADLIGLEKAQLLAQYFATYSAELSSRLKGIQLILPTDGYERVRRQVLAGLLAGRSKNEIALHVGVHKRTVYRIISELRDAGRLKSFDEARSRVEAARCEAVLAGIEAGHSYEQIAAGAGCSRAEIVQTVRALREAKRLPPVPEGQDLRRTVLNWTLAGRDQRDIASDLRRAVYQIADIVEKLRAAGKLPPSERGGQ